MRRKAIVVLLMGSFAVASFAMLGDGRYKNRNNKTLLTHHNILIPKSGFSLKSGYNYRGSSVINSTVDPNDYINLNTVITYEKGNRTYILPIKSKVLVNNVKIGIGVPLLNR
ncbi:MAG TPA: hypothetical protein VFS36_07180 [Chitinophagaceae bacterium]|jgi:hypothetical protein|nr:hypothetical protein [Chitinophagaceae bacterium]